MFDLSGPMSGCAVTQCRHLFIEGDLKFKDNISKVDKLLILIQKFTEVGTFSKFISSKYVFKKKNNEIKNIKELPFLSDK